MKILSLLGLTAFATISSATVLTFGDLNLSNYGVIPASYGDNVTSVGGAGGSYLQGNAFTPDIKTSYDTVDAFGVSTNASLLYWNTGYGDLTDVAFSASNGLYARLTLTPSAGFNVVLNSFDLASYPATDLQAAKIRVIDASGTQLWSSSNLTVKGTGPSHSSYAPGLSSSSALTIEYGVNWNIGLDNVNFDQTRAVPEPATFLILGIGAAAVGRKKK